MLGNSAGQISAVNTGKLGQEKKTRLSGGFVSFATRVFVAFEGGFENSRKFVGRCVVAASSENKGAQFFQFFLPKSVFCEILPFPNLPDQPISVAHRIALGEQH